MSFFSKFLKKSTNIIDPVGHYLRKATGGSYGDPLNQYNSHPNTGYSATYQPVSHELMAAPGGQNTLATINLGGGNMGGRTYAPNPFQGQPPPQQMAMQQPQMQPRQRPMMGVPMNTNGRAMLL